MVKFASAFGDAHLAFDPKTYEKWGPLTEYPFEIRETDKKYSLSKIDSPSCSLKVDDEITRIDGKSISDRIAENTTLIGASNPVATHQRAIRRLWRSPFLPLDRQIIEGVHDGKVSTCEVKALPFKSLGLNHSPSIHKRMSADVACKAMGFENANHDFKFDLGASPRMNSATSPFPAAILTTPKGKKIGVIRIASFREEDFPDVCLTTWDKFKKSCGKECRQQFFDHSISPRLIEELKISIEKIKAQSITAVVVDLTFNGGGSGWGDKAAALFTKKPFACDPFGLIRHPKWTLELNKSVKKLEGVLRDKRLSNLQREIARQELKHVKNLAEESKKKCDRSSLWVKGSPSPSCKLLIKDPASLCGIDNDILEEAYAGNKISTRLSSPDRGIYDGELYILTNYSSASESESFAKLLKESGAAKEVGESTMGVGCGFATDFKPVPLKYSRIALEIPDCQRFFQNGESELQGILPDIPLSTTYLGSPGFASSLAKTLK